MKKVEAVWLSCPTTDVLVKNVCWAGTFKPPDVKLCRNKDFYLAENLIFKKSNSL